MATLMERALGARSFFRGDLGMAWHEVVRAAVEAHGVPLRELCRRQGWTESERVVMQNCRTGRKRLDSDRLEKLCRAVGLDLKSRGSV